MYKLLIKKYKYNLLSLTDFMLLTSCTCVMDDLNKLDILNKIGALRQFPPYFLVPTLLSNPLYKISGSVPGLNTKKILSPSPVKI